MRLFAELPGLVEESLREHARVALVYFDAFGWRFFERHSGHPLFRDAAAERWTSQFPSTTAVHTTTLQTGLPVGEHGLYEWNLYEPRLDRLITPLWFCFAGDRERDTLLAAGLEPADVFPFSTLYERLEVPCHVVNPIEYAFSTPNTRLSAGATTYGYREPAEGFARLAGALASEERGYGMIHLPALDGLMHYEGPGSPEVDGLIEATLSDLAAASWPEGTLLLLTADHGMAAVSPERTSYVNVVW
ncbi:MAG: alkaline phosphatase family protein, partial [Gaiellaceae bacterium]